MTPIRTDCITTYKASRHSGTRKLDEIRLIVLHDTEGGTAKSVARYFAQPINHHTGQPSGSSHLVVDDDDCYRCLTNIQVPWAAPGANTMGFHIEQCGFASWDAKEWMDHPQMLQRAAFKTAWHCRLFDIPAVFLNASALKMKRSGITTHAQCSKAFGGTHTDPGDGWPQVHFMDLVRKYRADLQPLAV